MPMKAKKRYFPRKLTTKEIFVRRVYLNYEDNIHETEQSAVNEGVSCNYSKHW